MIAMNKRKRHVKHGNFEERKLLHPQSLKLNDLKQPSLRHTKFQQERKLRNRTS